MILITCWCGQTVDMAYWSSYGGFYGNNNGWSKTGSYSLC